MKKFILLIVLFVPLVLVSCGGDEDKQEPTNSPNNSIKEIRVGDNFWLNLDDEDDHAFIRMSVRNNGIEFTCFPVHDYFSQVRVVRIGNTSNLQDINTIPSDGWISIFTSSITNGTYPFAKYNLNDADGYVIEYIHASQIYYIRLRIKALNYDASGNIFSVDMQYQFFN